MQLHIPHRHNSTTALAVNLLLIKLQRSVHVGIEFYITILYMFGTETVSEHFGVINKYYKWQVLQNYTFQLFSTDGHEVIGLCQEQIHSFHLN